MQMREPPRLLSNTEAKLDKISNLLGYVIDKISRRNLSIRDAYLATGNVPSRLPNPCVYLIYLSICIDFDDFRENTAALCLLRACSNLQELEVLAQPKEQTSVERSNNFWEDDHYELAVRPPEIGNITSHLNQKLDFVKLLLSSSFVLERLTVKPASLEGERELMKEVLRFRQASVYTEVIYLEP
ncbi:hypothetical protein J1N35_030670 [Gossypium stocksii]|uniref:FBD domain-containing protein n=1 Tax=Gossypium stocksii TaxID=47602 RepID=A0A9D3V0E4_9ROSI|nr:hypothetical protein J1N35_030670 [Gossypium stocksii]